jgi:hypothetical protein
VVKLPLAWDRLRPWDGSVRTAFEMLCNHFAAHEPTAAGAVFIPKAPPDGGVESYWAYRDGTEWGFQAKFFTSSLGASEWGQIDDSVKTALLKHPNLTRYTVCLPIDRADPRKPGQEWFKDAWDKHVAKWTQWATEQNRTVDFDYWGETELSDRFAQERHAGRHYFWFHKELFSDEWFRIHLERTKENAGPRYTPKLNVELPVSRAFEGLYRSRSLWEEMARLQKRIGRHASYRVTESDAFAGDKIDALNATAGIVVSELESLFQTPLQEPIAFDAVGQAAQRAIAAARQVENALDTYEESKREEVARNRQKDGNPLPETRSMYSDLQYRLREFRSGLYELLELFKSDMALAANASAMLLKGGGGCGKTHLLCDRAFARLTAHAPAILLLGQQFTNGSVWTQVLNQLGLSCNAEEFLGALQLAGEIRGETSLFSIDALNEGEGKRFWRSQLAGFLADFRRYPGIKVAVSVRSTYEDLCIPDHIPLEQLLHVEHPGFATHEYAAAKAFFTFYKIQQPRIPMLVPEFQNPLFLKVFCQGLNNQGMTVIPPGLHGLSSVFTFFINSIEAKLSKPEYLDYDRFSMPVSKGIDALTDTMAATGLPHVERTQAMAALATILPSSGFENSLFRHLVSEGLLAEDQVFDANLSNQWVEVVHFAYERFTDHLTCKRLLDKHLDVNNPSGAFVSGGALHRYLDTSRSASMNKGLLDALCIQLPERIGREVPDLALHARDYTAMRNAFLESFSLRDTAAFSDSTLSYLNEVVLQHPGGWEGLLDVLLLVATNPLHPYNAHRLHAKLETLSLAHRDSVWTLYLCRSYKDRGAADRLLDWAVSTENTSYVDDESLELCGIALGWFLTSSNRTQRDLATKGLVRLFTNRLKALLKVLGRFTTVNDPYVAERLYAIAYGCSLRSIPGDDLKALAIFAYTNIFSHGAPPPNILLRDYARGIVEIALHRGATLQIVKKRIRPPYKSDWPDEIPTKQELETKFADKDKRGVRTWSSILSSVLEGGDFERYIIGTNHGNFEWSSRRIGETGPPLSKYDDAAMFDLQIAQRWIFNRVTELGWSPELFSEFDNGVGDWSDGRRPDKAERIGKKYQWIAYYEFLGRVSDNFVYLGDEGEGSDKTFTGPWQVSSVRNIDPSCLLRADFGDSHKATWWSPLQYSPTPAADAAKLWVEDAADLPNMASLLQVRRPSDGSRWLVLETHRSFEEPIPLGRERFDRPFSQLWCQVRSYLVKKPKADAVFQWLSHQNFWGKWMPESTQEYNIFLGEYFWSAAYKSHDNPYHSHSGWTEGWSKKGIPAPICVTAEEYHQERGYDCSIDEALRIMLPAKELSSGMKLSWSGYEGLFHDSQGKVVAIDPAVAEAGSHALLIQQDALQAYLDENDLALVWTVCAGKQHMEGGGMNHRDWKGELQVNGAYRLINGEVHGNLTTTFNGPQTDKPIRATRAP